MKDASRRLSALELTAARRYLSPMLASGPSTSGSGRSTSRSRSLTRRFSSATHHSISAADTRSATPADGSAGSTGSVEVSTGTPASAAACRTTERKLRPMAARRSSSGVQRRSTPIRSRKSLVTSVDAVKAGASEGNRLSSASQSTILTTEGSRPSGTAKPGVFGILVTGPPRRSRARPRACCESRRGMLA